MKVWLLVSASLCAVVTGCADTSDDNRSGSPPTGTKPPSGRLAFLPPEGFREPIRLVRADGSARERAAGPANRIPWALSWAPDGSRIAYVFSGTRQTSSIAVLDLRSRRAPLLAPPPAGRGTWRPSWRQVAWAPRPDRIAAVRSGPALGSRASVEILNGRGEPVARGLAPDVSSQSRMSWSPDGERLAYGTRHGAIGLVTVASGTRDTVESPVQGSDPAWSPDGRWIAFASRRGVAVISPTGNSFRLLTRNGRMDKTPTWSPDGRWIAFARQRGGCDAPDASCAQDIHLVPAAGGRARVVRRTPKLIETSPVWAPR